MLSIARTRFAGVRVRTSPIRRAKDRGQETLLIQPKRTSLRRLVDIAKKAPLAGPEAVLRYLSRYTHRSHRVPSRTGASSPPTTVASRFAQ